MLVASYLMINIICNIFNLVSVLRLRLSPMVFHTQFEPKNLNLHINIINQPKCNLDRFLSIVI